MSLDRRLRDELQRDAQRIVPDVERNLGAVEARARRRVSIGTPTLLAAAAVIAVAIVIRVQTAPSSVGGPSQSPTTSAAPSPALGSPTYDAIAGTYTLSIDPQLPAATSAHLGGTWTMRLLPDGEMLLSTPQTFAYGSIAPSGIAFSLVGDRFRTNLFYNDFCNSVGTYTWSLAGDSLSFAPVTETCTIRETLLATAPWQRAP